MLSRIKKLTKHPLFFPLALTFLFFVVNLILVLNHEPWRDEANVWQGAKTLSYSNFYDIFSVEPHPPLWFILLAPLAKLGLPMIFSSFLSLAVVTMAVFILAKFAPFSKKLKVILVFSAAFFYVLPVMSRNYALVPLALSLIACLYQNRLKHPIRYALALALLFQSHFLTAGLAGILTIFFIYDIIKQKQANSAKSKLLPVILIVASSIVVSLPMIIGSLTEHSIVRETFIHSITHIDWLLEINRTLFGVTFPIFELAIIPILIYLLLNAPRQFVYLACALGFHLLIVISTYDFGIFQTQKNTLFLLYVIFAFWIANYEKNTIPIKPIKWLNQKINRLELVKLLRLCPATTLLAIFALASLPNIIYQTNYDLKSPYSYSLAVTDYLNQNTPANSVYFVGDPPAAGSAIAFVPHLKENRKFYDLASQDFINFYQYKKYPELGKDDILKLIREYPGSNLYYIAGNGSSCQTSTAINPDWPLLKTFDANAVAFETRLDIYQINDPISLATIDEAKVADIFDVTDIPRLDITTPADFTTEYGVWNSGVSLKFAEETTSLNGKMRTRGTTTYEAGRKYGPYQYKVKLDSRTSLLGMAPHKEWVLLANFMDRSYLRQFYLSGIGQLLMGEEYFSPQMRYVELFMDGEYKGLYLLAESIEENKNRLNIELDISPEDQEIPYLVQMENGRMSRLWNSSYDQSTIFMIDDQANVCYDYPQLEGAKTTDTMMSLEYPESLDDITKEQGDYVKTQVAKLYQDARNAKPFFELDIDHASFVNYFAFQELMYNTGFGSSSIYFYRPLNGKITAGPLWDFDQLLMVGSRAGFTQPHTCDNNLYRYLLKYPEFKSLLSARLKWFDQKLGPIIQQEITKLQNNSTLRSAVIKNEAKYRTWGRYFPDLSVYQNPDVVALTSWDQHIENLTSALFVGYTVDQKPASRAAWLDANISNLK